MAPSSENETGAQELRQPATDQTSTRFRFKRKHSHDVERDEDGHHRRHRRHHRHHHHRHHRHQSKRSKAQAESVDDASAYDDSVSSLPPEAAFRESLFDALGDDEGAAFWQGVYGQPIHTFPNTYQDERTGELEQMNDEEYAQFVRRKMWEKSWEGIEAAKEAKRQEVEQEKQERNRRERTRDRRRSSHTDTNHLFDLDIEQSLRRGEQRRDRKRWRMIWNEYLQSWDRLDTLCHSVKSNDGQTQLSLRNKISWPVESGKRQDVNSQEVKRFIEQCAAAQNENDAAIKTILKSERVRWHPDKIQHRYGSIGIDEHTVQSVTAVFQIIDRMWNDQREKG